MILTSFGHFYYSINTQKECYLNTDKRFLSRSIEEAIKQYLLFFNEYLLFFTIFPQHFSFA